MKLPSLCTILVLFFLPTLAEPVSADLILYTNEATFLAAANSVKMESFESLNATNALDLQSVVTDDFTITADEINEIGVFDRPEEGAFATDMDQYLRTQPDDPIEFTFSQSSNAFGFYVTDFENPLGFDNLNLTIGGESFNLTNENFADGESRFFGVVDSTGSFLTAELSTIDTIGIDQVYTQFAAVPEPSSFALIGSVLAVALVRRRLVKKKNATQLS